MSTSGGSRGTASPLTTKGDVWGFSTLNARIPIGSDTQVLTADSTQPLGLKWAATGGFVNPMTTLGDLILGGAAGAAGRLGIGAPGTVLNVDVNAGTVGWNTGFFTNPMTTGGDLIYGASTTTDYAQGQTCSANGSNAGHTCSNAFTGVDDSSYWYAPNQGAGEVNVDWIGVDLGSQKSVGSARIFQAGTGSSSFNNAQFYATGFKIQGSNTGFAGPWTDVISSGTLTFPSNPTVLNFTAVSYRYWRAILTGATAGDRWVVGSFKLFAGAAGVPNRLGIGSTGQVLQVVGGLPAWGAVPGGSLTFPLTAAGDETFQPGGVASNALTLHNNASAVNGFTITGAATGLAPTFTATGSDTNIGLDIEGKGSGAITIGTTSTGTITLGNSSIAGVIVQCTASAGNFVVRSAAGVNCFLTQNVASSVNYTAVTNAVTGAGPIIQALGSDTNIDLILNSKGTGLVNIGPASASAAISGATPATLATGTGGATGPATAAQNAWLAVKINGTTSYVPFWR